MRSPDASKRRFRSAAWARTNDISPPHLFLLSDEAGYYWRDAGHQRSLLMI